MGVTGGGLIGPDYEDQWILNKFLLNNPREFIPQKEKLKEQLQFMPEIYKKNLKWEMEEAERLYVDIDLLARTILLKTFIH